MKKKNAISGMKKGSNMEFISYYTVIKFVLFLIACLILKHFTDTTQSTPVFLQRTISLVTFFAIFVAGMTIAAKISDIVGNMKFGKKVYSITEHKIFLFLSVSFFSAINVLGNYLLQNYFIKQAELEPLSPPPPQLQHYLFTITALGTGIIIYMIVQAYLDKKGNNTLSVIEKGAIITVFLLSIVFSAVK